MNGLTPAEGAQQFGVASVAAREGERGEEAWNTMIENREVLFAGLVSQGAGEPAFADAARPCDDEVVARADPFAGGKLAEKSTIETAGGTIIR